MLARTVGTVTAEDAATNRVCMSLPIDAAWPQIHQAFSTLRFSASGLQIFTDAVGAWLEVGPRFA